MRIPLAILGLSGIIGPLLLMREVMAVSGSDALGSLAVLSACCLWQATGAWLAEHRGRGVPFSPETGSTWARPYTRLLILIALFLPLQIVLLRATPIDWLGGWRLIWMSALLTAPLNLTLGAQYALGRRLLEIQEGAPSRAFVFLALGVVVGGILFAALTTSLFQAAQIALALAALNLAAAWWIGSYSELHLADGLAAPLTAYAFIVAAIVIGTIALPLGATLREATLRRQWSGLRAAEDSARGRILMVQTEKEDRFYWSGIQMLAAPSDRDREFIQRAIAAHPNPRRLMLVGSGPSGLNTALAHPLISVRLAQPDPVLIEIWLRNAEPKTLDALNSDQFELAATEARSFLRSVIHPFDVIAINLPGPISDPLNRYYTAEFWALVRTAMAADGVLAVRGWNATGSEICTKGVLTALTAHFAPSEKLETTNDAPLILHPLENPSQTDMLSARINRDLVPRCPGDQDPMAGQASNLWEWMILYGWLGLPMGLLFLMGWTRRALISPLMPAFATLAGGGILTSTMVGLHRSLGLLYVGTAELAAGFAAGVAAAGIVFWLLQNAIQNNRQILSSFIALFFQCILAWFVPEVIQLFSGDPLLPWIAMGLLMLSGLPVGISLSVAGSLGRPGAAFVAASAGGAVGITLAGLPLVSGIDLAVAGQAVATTAALGLLWFFRKA